MTSPERDEKKRKLDADDIEALAEAFIEEVPAVGTAKRLWERVKLRIAREYIDEIERLAILNEKLQHALVEQTEVNSTLVRILELKTQEMKSD